MRASRAGWGVWEDPPFSVWHSDTLPPVLPLLPQGVTSFRWAGDSPRGASVRAAPRRRVRRSSGAPVRRSNDRRFGNVAAGGDRVTFLRVYSPLLRTCQP